MILNQRITANDTNDRDYFGGSVSISGDYAIVGAPHHSYFGSAYIFKKEGSSWIQITNLAADDGELNDEFGNSVSISGDYAIIGAHSDGDGFLNQDIGSAYIFKKNEMIGFKQRS